MKHEAWWALYSFDGVMAGQFGVNKSRNVSEHD